MKFSLLSIVNVVKTSLLAKVGIGTSLCIVSANIISKQTASKDTVSMPKASVTATSIPKKTLDSTQGIISADSLDIQIGQMILFGFYGSTLNEADDVYKAVKQGKVGGILLYERNIASQHSKFTLQSLINGYKKAATIPLFVSIDQEGGGVNRLKTKYGFKPMQSAKYVGSKNDSAISINNALTIALACNEVGINLNYAPVLDVHNSNNPVLGKKARCFSNDASIITKHAQWYIAAHHTHNVLTVVKHFPGHGTSTTDSHKGLTDVSKTWQPFEVEPYKTLITANQIDMVMTAHIVNAQLDARNLPATLSDSMIQGLLRNSLHFDGVVVSDDMHMKAISNFYSFKEAVKKSILAGVDILMFSNNIEGVAGQKPEEVHAMIRSMVLSGEIPRERITQSFERIRKLKMRL
jgi:beta-N-acetylhexosaminidase